MTAKILPLQASALSRSFDGFAALGPLSFSVEHERVVGVLGPSGCGKSTLLRLLSGLDQPSQGEVRLMGKPITGPSQDIGIVFQEPRLLPWLSVEENVGLGLWHLPKVQRDELVRSALQTVGLSRFAHALPKALSGGMAQRVGIARALVLRPRMLLLDEPFGALDPLTRVKMQDHLLELVGDSVPLVVVITHDIEEAVVLSDRILVLDGPPGRIRLDVEVDLPRPRQRSSQDFQAIKQRLANELMDQVVA